ncbi:epithelial-stromal interaction protein 1 isoform X2 [Mesocricetus auratus]|uniref:Epithelial-stromal interaction protein 1 isoform X2 n=1 Tax=Mesocricetus auratus TaxID=10036 RepID=A0A3Q0CRW9_MESAU|nr:epithelial-stromal interaction protein 1 isoform X2 [Mesocricetus auratus]
MYTHTRSRVVDPGLGTSSISRDHAGHGQRRELGLQQSQRQSLEVPVPKDAMMERQGRADQKGKSTREEKSLKEIDSHAPPRGVMSYKNSLPRSSGVGVQHTGTHTLIAPNESRRQKMQRIAEQELADLERWRQQNRPKAVYSVPQRLGGSQSESEVRQKQQLQQMRSKYQQKLKRDESIRIRKEAEEAKLQHMKAIQREKSNRLEEKRQLQETLRRDTFREHHQKKTAAFLSRLDPNLRNRSACQSVPHTDQSSTWKLPVLPRDSSWNKLLETKGQHQEEERARIHQAEHWRVNNAFLDRLQGKSQPGGLEQSGGCKNMNSTNSWGI